MKKSLKYLRKKIDKIDEEILFLLKNRFDLMPDIAKYKKNKNLGLRQVEREKKSLNKNIEKAKNLGINENFVLSLFSLIFNQSKKIQENFINLDFVLIIDNYDSFTYNLYQYVGELNKNPIVFKNDEINLEEIKELNPSHIILSPGPGRPENKKDFGICKEILKNYDKSIPVLGVCLGHQGICNYFGGRIINAPLVMHGEKSKVRHGSSILFENIPKEFEVMRYHSLIVDKKDFPENLKITASTINDNLIMAVEDIKYPIFGIQFHPESIGTKYGKKILENFLEQ